MPDYRTVFGSIDNYTKGAIQIVADIREATSSGIVSRSRPARPVTSASPFAAGPREAGLPGNAGGRSWYDPEDDA
jgi:hypothetical protein